jgi:hypothetical protein
MNGVEIRARDKSHVIWIRSMLGGRLVTYMPLLILVLAAFARADYFVGQNPSYRDTTFYRSTPYTFRYVLADSTVCSDTTHRCYARYYGTPYGDVSAGIITRITGAPRDTVTFTCTFDPKLVPSNDVRAVLEVVRYTGSPTNSFVPVVSWSFRIEDKPSVGLNAKASGKPNRLFVANAFPLWYIRPDGRFFQK